MNKKILWNREEEIIVLDLYCQIPFNKASKSNPQVIEIAKLINRSPSSVTMKIGNFGRFDESLKVKNISGLKNGSKLDEEIWNEFNSKWDELSLVADELKNNYKSKTKHQNSLNIPLGNEKYCMVKSRINQQFFRNSVLSSYNNCCCITGLANTPLLIASHIKPWNSCTDREKTNPRNGLCLNPLHDKAFDKGFITIDKNYNIIVSTNIKDNCENNFVNLFFNKYNKKQISLPDKFIPDKEFLEYHNDIIFENWKKIC